MIVLIVYQEGSKLITSHGIDMDTDEVVILPPEHPSTLGARIHSEHGWVLIK